jgi:hypothetical protein
MKILHKVDNSATPNGYSITLGTASVFAYPSLYRRFSGRFKGQKVSNLTEIARDLALNRHPSPQM